MSWSVLYLLRSDSTVTDKLTKSPSNKFPVTYLSSSWLLTSLRVSFTSSYQSLRRTQDHLQRVRISAGSRSKVSYLSHTGHFSLVFGPSVCVWSCGTQFSCSGLPASGEMNHSAPLFEFLKCPLEVLRSHELPGSARTKAGNCELWLRLTISQREVSQRSLLNELQPSAFLSYTFWLLTSMQEFSSARQTHTHIFPHTS